jgi:hypothetical protein
MEIQTVTDENEQPLNVNQVRFVEVYCSLSPRKPAVAYMRVYCCKPADAARNGWRLLKDPRIKRAIEERDKAAREANSLAVGDLIAHLTEIIKANPADLIEYRRGACRYCWGDGFQYQRTQGEYNRDLAAYLEANKAAHERSKGKVALDPLGLFFDVKGGIGYNRNEAPHPECPECFGDGEGFEFVKDTRSLPPAAARLYGGLKITRDGISIVTRSQDKSLEMALQVAGLLGTKRSGDDEEGDTPPAASVTYHEVDARAPQDYEGEE